MRIYLNKYPNLLITFQNQNIHIVNSYHITDDTMKLEILELINQQVTINRSLKSQLTEWKAHNVLYRWHIVRSRTQTVDINENESLFARAAYKILALFE